MKAAAVLFAIGASYFAAFALARTILGEGELSRVVGGLIGLAVMIGIGLATRRD